jgi:hypothetical protein
MGAHTPIAGVQQTGCRALRKLASNDDENRAAIARAGGIEAVVAGMGALMCAFLGPAIDRGSGEGGPLGVQYS